MRRSRRNAIYPAEKIRKPRTRSMGRTGSSFTKRSQPRTKGSTRKKAEPKKPGKPKGKPTPAT
ncbi:hypothetical protein D3C75_1121350 [compost metagenome]